MILDTFQAELKLRNKIRELAEEIEEDQQILMNKIDALREIENELKTIMEKQK